jgi:hypothetical protein
VLGPLLTLSIYKHGKRGLKFDLACIAVLQVGALLYGLGVIFETRPAYIVAMSHRVVVVHANELHPDPPPQAPYDRAPWLGPVMVSLRQPEDQELAQRVLMEELEGKPRIEQRPAFYAPLEDGFDALFDSPLSLEPLLKHNPGHREWLERWLAKRGVSDPNDAAFLPLMTRNREIALLVDTRNKRLLGMLDLASDYD